jgi:hypothetical protein
MFDSNGFRSISPIEERGGGVDMGKPPPMIDSNGSRLMSVPVPRIGGTGETVEVIPDNVSDLLTPWLLPRAERIGARLTSGEVGTFGSANISDASEGKFTTTESNGSRFTRGPTDCVGSANKSETMEGGWDPRNEKSGFRSISGPPNELGEVNAVVSSEFRIVNNECRGSKLISGACDVLGKGTLSADSSDPRLIKGCSEVAGKLTPRPEKAEFRFSSCETRGLEPIAESSGLRSNKG